MGIYLFFFDLIIRIIWIDFKILPVFVKILVYSFFPFLLSWCSYSSWCPCLISTWLTIFVFRLISSLRSSGIGWCLMIQLSSLNIIEVIRLYQYIFKLINRRSILIFIKFFSIKSIHIFLQKPLNSFLISIKIFLITWARSHAQILWYLGILRLNLSIDSTVRRFRRIIFFGKFLNIILKFSSRNMRSFDSLNLFLLAKVLLNFAIFGYLMILHVLIGYHFLTVRALFSLTPAKTHVILILRQRHL